MVSMFFGIKQLYLLNLIFQYLLIILLLFILFKFRKTTFITNAIDI